MPEPRRCDVRPPQVADGEKETLVAFLDYLREGVAAKAEGAPEPGVRSPGVPSGTSVLGLVTHLTAVEGVYFLGAHVADWAATMRPDPARTVDDVVAAYRDTVTRANTVIADYTDLSRPAPRKNGPYRLTHDALAARPHDRGDRPPRRPRRHPARTARRRRRSVTTHRHERRHRRSRY